MGELVWGGIVQLIKDNKYGDLTSGNKYIIMDIIDYTTVKLINDRGKQGHYDAMDFLGFDE
tara:strand:+ start:115 stop:297 length:183 start_codon:yes stop_codon:yes gene_type:complete